MESKSLEEHSLDILTPQQRDVFEITFFVFFGAIVCAFGITANVINIIIYFTQGFSYTVNISFAALAISDLCCLLLQMVYSLCNNPFVKYRVSFIPAEVLYLSGGVPSVCFSRITGWITVFITAERCLCIAIPLKVKRLITARRTGLAMLGIFLVNIIAIVPSYQKLYLGWKFYSGKNRTLLGLMSRGSDDGSDSLSYILTFLTGVLSFLAVIVFTVVLVTKLAQTSEWRRKAASAIREKMEAASNRERKTMKIIILIASIMIVCYTPATLMLMVTHFQPAFSLLGRYGDSFISLWSIAFLFQDVSSSVNIFLYYSMSTKYRHTFQELFAKCKCGK